jgi:hypothetical protein
MMSRERDAHIFYDRTKELAPAFLEKREPWMKLDRVSTQTYINEKRGKRLLIV